MTSHPQVLTIAGSDSSGGAGIQADLKTFAALHTYGASVITALTAQNTLGVDAVEAISPDFVSKQLSTTLSDLDIKCAKTGMLANASIIRQVADTWASQSPRVPLIVDPVMVSTSGHELLQADAVSSMKEHLLPIATMVTPNLPEGLILAEAGQETKAGLSAEKMKDVCRAIAKHGPSYVLLKGGHAAGQGILDMLYDAQADDFTTFQHQRVDTKNTHGTGCTLSAAICAFISRGMSAPDAVKHAIDYVQIALHTSYQVGSGAGPVNHLHSTSLRCLPPPTSEKASPFTSRLIEACKPDWEEYVWENAFIQGLRDATLPPAAFVHFLKQDYVFLEHYARVFALAAYKADTFEEMREANELAASILREVKLHEKLCEKFGTTADELEQEATGTVAYTRYVLDIGHSKSTLHLRVATAPCFLGYAEVGRRLAQDPQTVRGDKNPYWTWIEEYSSDWFQEAAEKSLHQTEAMAQRHVFTEEQMQDLSRVFETATRMEAAFFKQSVNAVEQG